MMMEVGRAGPADSNGKVIEGASDVILPVTADVSSTEKNLSDGKRKRCRRKRKAGYHHRNWKLTWDVEKQALGDGLKFYKRATYLPLQPMAPCNTNEFLMQDRGSQFTPTLTDDKPRERTRSRRKSTTEERSPGTEGMEDRSPGDGGSSDDQFTSNESDYEDDYEAFSREYRKEVENQRMNVLQAMRKEDLIRECWRLDALLEQYQSENEKLKRERDILIQMRDSDPQLNPTIASDEVE